MGPGRRHALVDGVFAIAVTLLVLDLPHPGGSDRLAHDLLAAWPTYVPYLVSFVTVGVLWIEHTGMLSAVRYVNRRLLADLARRALAERGGRADPPRRRRGRGPSTRTPAHATVALSAPPHARSRPMVKVIFLFRFRADRDPEYVRTWRLNEQAS